MKWIDFEPRDYDSWALDNARHDDVYDAIRYAAERSSE